MSSFGIWARFLSAFNVLHKSPTPVSNLSIRGAGKTNSEYSSAPTDCKGVGLNVCGSWVSSSLSGNSDTGRARGGKRGLRKSAAEVWKSVLNIQLVLFESEVGMWQLPSNHTLDN
jgi:hypothetical protein